MKSIFISDLHLSTEQPALFAAFETFAQGLSTEVQQLYILGDLFEVWLGDDDNSAFASSVKQILKRVSDQGINVFVQRGNRDFLLASKFAKETGCEILPDYYVFQAYGQKALLMHGDLLCTDDLDYQRFRKRVHNPLCNLVMRNLPLCWRKKIARDWRTKSKNLNQNKADNIMDVNTETVIQCMQEHHVETLIHGHTHRPCDHRLDNGCLRRMVLGDWGEKIWWIEADEQGFKLLSAAAL